MKKLLVFGLLMLSTSVFAHGPRGYYYNHGHYNGGYNNWVAPLIVGGVIGYAINRQSYPPPTPVYVPAPPVYVPTPAPVIVQTYPQCSAWVETYNTDGTITRTRTCTQ